MKSKSSLHQLKNKKITIFGSGNIGRALIPELLNNEYQINFLDVSRDKIRKLNSVSKYKIYYLEKDKKNFFEVKNFKSFFIDEKNKSETKKIINKSNIIFTCVGKDNLNSVAKILSKHIIKNTFPKTILAFENANRATSILKNFYLKKYQGYQGNNIQFVNTIIDRIVPSQTFDPQKIYSEKDFSVIADQKDIIFPIKIKKLKIKKDLDKYIFRKFLLLNTIHTYIAWIGINKNYLYVSDVLKNPKIETKAKLLGKELIKIIISKFSFQEKELSIFLNKSIERFKNNLLKDECKRVGKSVLRKLSYNERFILPLRISLEKNIKISILKKAINLGLKIKNKDDPETLKRDKIIQDNPENYLEIITKLKSL